MYRDNKIYDYKYSRIIHLEAKTTLGWKDGWMDGSVHLDILKSCRSVCLICPFSLFVCWYWSFTTQSITRLCRAGHLIEALFLDRLRPTKGYLVLS